MQGDHLIVVRHGERLDYVMRDRGENWTVQHPDAPWDPPLTDHGHEQGQKLGQHLQTQKDIPPISKIYTSPLLRCRQTAVAIQKGLESDTTAVTVYNGLAESFNEAWYRSWALPDSNGTWGHKSEKYSIDNKQDLHPAALMTVPELLQQWQQERAAAKGSLSDIKESPNDLAEKCRIEPYTLNPDNRLLETREHQRQRMVDAVNTLASHDRSTAQTVLVVSHGGPVCHLFEGLTGKSWKAHGPSSYACYSIYRRGDNTWEPVAINQASYLHEEIVVEDHMHAEKS